MKIMSLPPSKCVEIRQQDVEPASPVFVLGKRLSESCLMVSKQIFLEDCWHIFRWPTAGEAMPGPATSSLVGQGPTVNVGPPASVFAVGVLALESPAVSSFLKVVPHWKNHTVTIGVTLSP
jgi:hypothetical protein